MLEKRPEFTQKKNNQTITIVNEGIAITGYAQLQAYGLSGTKEDMGFETTYSMKNESGADRDVDWTITNVTQGTTLSSGSVTLSDGEVSSASDFWTLEKVTPGDYLRFTIGNEGIGTAGGSGTFASFSWDVRGVLLSENA